MSSTSRSVKGAAADLLLVLEKLLLQVLREPRTKLVTEGRFPSISSPGSIVYRLLQHLWFQVLLLSFFCSSSISAAVAVFFSPSFFVVLMLIYVL